MLYLDFMEVEGFLSFDHLHILKKNDVRFLFLF
jgi:hypothetical protein